MGSLKSFLVLSNSSHWTPPTAQQPKTKSSSYCRLKKIKKLFLCFMSTQFHSFDRTIECISVSVTFHPSMLYCLRLHWRKKTKKHFVAWRITIHSSTKSCNTLMVRRKGFHVYLIAVPLTSFGQRCSQN